MNEWASRMLHKVGNAANSVLADASSSSPTPPPNQGLSSFVTEIDKENVDKMDYRTPFDGTAEFRVTFEQISHERIINEINKDVAMLRGLEYILSDRITGVTAQYNTWNKMRGNFDSFEYCEGTLRTALDSFFVLVDQECQHANRASFLTDVKKKVVEMRTDAQRRLVDYQKDLAHAEKDLLSAEKRLAKSKDHLEKAMERRASIESVPLEFLGNGAGIANSTQQQSTSPTTSTTTTTTTTNNNSNNNNSNNHNHNNSTSNSSSSSTTTTYPANASGSGERTLKYEHSERKSKPVSALGAFRETKVRESDESIAKAEQDIKEDLRAVVRCIETRDSLHAASRRAFQYLDTECKATAQQTLTKLAQSQLQSNSLHTAVLDKFGVSAGAIDIDGDAAQFIVNYSVPPERGALILSSQALSMLDDLTPRSQNGSSMGTSRGGTPSPSRKNSLKIADASADNDDGGASSDADNSSIKSGSSRASSPEASSSSSVSSSSARISASSSSSSSRMVWPVAPVGGIVAGKASVVDKMQFVEHLSNIFFSKVGPSSPCSSSSSGGSSSSSSSSSSSRTMKSSVFYDGPKYIIEPEHLIAVEWLSRQVQSLEGRDAFIVELNQFRSRKVELPPAGFNALASVLWEALNYCQMHNDVHNAKVIMMLSQTFYRQIKKKEKSGVAYGETNEGSDEENIEENNNESTDSTQWFTNSRKPGAADSDDEVASATVPENTNTNTSRRARADSDSDSDSDSDMEFHDASDAPKTLGTKGAGAPRDKSGSRKALAPSPSPSPSPFPAQTTTSVSVSSSSDQEKTSEAASKRRSVTNANRGASRQYIKVMLSTHAIWRDGHFWEEALCQCAFEQLQTMPYEKPWHDMDASMRHTAVRQVHDVVFSQVMALVHSMMELNCTKAQAREFLYRMCVVHQLGEAQRQLLLAHIADRGTDNDGSPNS